LLIINDNGIVKRLFLKVGLLLVMFIGKDVHAEY
jgi:hypothetical protein